MKRRYFIDTHKGATFLFVLLLMAVYRQWENPTAWIYLGLHGSYGLLWVLKSRTFPDQRWEQSTSLWFGLLIWAGLSLYWIAPWIITSLDIHASAWLLGLCVGVFAFGVFMHFTSDMQKYVALHMQPEHLVQDGLWHRLRNPNYFGELLIYLSFALLALHWLPLLVLGLWVGVVWLPLMILKDRSLSRYADFSTYKKRSKLFIPYLF